MNLYKILLSFCFVFIAATVAAQKTPSADSSDNKIFTKVDTEAGFPGGDMGWRKYLEKNLNVNTPAENGAPSGKYAVAVKFIVDKNGNLSEVKALTNLGYGLEKEVIRIIQKSGTWQPAMQDGKAVDAYRIQPVTFLVEENGFKINTKVPYTFFTGMDNIITIEAGKVKPQNLNVTVSQGTITATDDGKFIVKVTKPGRVIIEVTNAKKSDKTLGTAIFDVKPLSEFSKN